MENSMQQTAEPITEPIAEPTEFTTYFLLCEISSDEFETISSNIDFIYNKFKTAARYNTYIETDIETGFMTEQYKMYYNAETNKCSWDKCKSSVGRSALKENPNAAKIVMVDKYNVVEPLYHSEDGNFIACNKIYAGTTNVSAFKYTNFNKLIPLYMSCELKNMLVEHVKQEMNNTMQTIVQTFQEYVRIGEIFQYTIINYDSLDYVPIEQFDEKVDNLNKIKDYNKKKDAELELLFEFLSKKDTAKITAKLWPIGATIVHNDDNDNANSNNANGNNVYNKIHFEFRVLEARSKNVKHETLQRGGKTIYGELQEGQILKYTYSFKISHELSFTHQQPLTCKDKLNNFNNLLNLINNYAEVYHVVTYIMRKGEPWAATETNGNWIYLYPEQQYREHFQEWLYSYFHGNIVESK